MSIVQIVGLFGILYMLFMVRGQLQAILECLQGSGAGGGPVGQTRRRI